jgi:hypothetical protein
MSGATPRGRKRGRPQHRGNATHKLSVKVLALFCDQRLRLEGRAGVRGFTAEVEADAFAEIVNKCPDLVPHLFPPGVAVPSTREEWFALLGRAGGCLRSFRDGVRPRDVLALLYGQEQRLAKGPGKILYLGKRLYQAEGAARPDKVSVREDGVLYPFLDSEVLTAAELRKLSRCKEAPRVLSQIRQNYPRLAGGIDLPQGKGKGGYCVRLTRKPS